MSHKGCRVILGFCWMLLSRIVFAELALPSHLAPVSLGTRVIMHPDRQATLGKPVIHRIPVAYPDVALPSHLTPVSLGKWVTITLDRQATFGKQVVRMIVYDAAIYDLAYQIYLQNNNLPNAYALSYSAVTQRPDNRQWRERLAQIAIWTARPEVAVKQYLYLAVHFNDVEAAIKGRKLATSIHDDATLVQFIDRAIHNGNLTDANAKEYIDANLRMGNIEDAIAFLNQNKSGLSQTLYLDYFSKIYTLQDDPEGELQWLMHAEAQADTNPWVAARIASLYVSKGEVNKAYYFIKKARVTAKSVDKRFWDIYADIAFLANENQQELEAYQHRLRNDPDLSVYTRLVELTTKNQPKVAYRYASLGRKAYPQSPVLVNYTLGLLAPAQKIETFPAVMASITPGLKKNLLFDPTYWNARVDYWKYQKNKAEVITSFITGIGYLPEDDFLKSDFLSFLIEKRQLALIRHILPLWQSDLPQKAPLWGVYAEAYAQLDNPLMTKLILELFYDNFEQYATNPLWLIAFKDMLEGSFFPKESAEINHYTWPIYLNRLRRQKTALVYKDLLNYTKLSMLDAPGDLTGAALYQLQDKVNEDTELLMITWALQNNDFSLAHGIYSYYLLLGMQPPLWASLSMSLQNLDRNRTRRILTNKSAIVSYRDRIRGADQINAIPLAQDIAFDSLKKHRHDQDLYDNFFVPTMIKTSPFAKLSQEYYQYASVAGPRSSGAFTYFLTPGISITPYESLWFSQNVGPTGVVTGQPLNAATNQELVNVPARDERAGLRLSSLLHRGTLDLDLGYRDNLTSFFNARLRRSYPVYNDVDAYLELGYHQQADDTVSMLVGGMKNKLELGVTYRILPNDTLFASYQQNGFYTQNGQYLAEGNQTTLSWEHKLWKTYPDWTLSAFGTTTQYYNKGNQIITGSAAQLIPQGAPQTVGFFIPSNFLMYGVTASVGQSYIDEYTHTWRPFGLVTLSNSTTVGIGELFNVGIAGSTVFGRDHLLLYYQWASNQGQGLQQEQLVKLAYKVYI